MNLKHVVFCVSFSLLFATSAVAQTIFTQEVTSWYVETPYGPVGYRAVEFGRGANGILRRYLELGPFGSIVLTTRMVIAGIVIAAILLVAITGLSIGRSRRRAHARHAIENTIDVTGAAGRKSVE